MTSSVQSPEDVVNLALGRIGYKRRIGNLYDGSAAATAALNIYAQTRDAVLRESDWGFAERIATATTTAHAAPIGWAYEYAYPSDCLRLKAVIPSGYGTGNNQNPLPTLFRVGNDNALSPAEKVIWSNTASATLVYTAQVTDMTTWEPLFVEALAAALGRRLAPVLANLETTKAAAEDEMGEAKGAEDIEG